MFTKPPEEEVVSEAGAGDSQDIYKGNLRVIEFLAKQFDEEVAKIKK